MNASVPSSKSCDQRAADALAGWQATVGEGASLALLHRPVLVPMHLAVDAKGFAVLPSGADAPRFFLKAYETDLPDLSDLDAVAVASRQAATLGLSPALQAVDLANASLLYDFLPASGWRMAKRADFERKSFTAAMLAAKRSWHASARLPRSRTPFEALAAHLGQLAAWRSDASVALPMPPGFDMLVAWVERIEQGLRAAGCDSVPIHGENAVCNTMVGAGDVIQWVDFDRAVNADPHYDLAGLCVELCSFDDEVNEVVTRYVGRRNACIAARVQLYMVVEDFLWGCWSLIAHRTSPRSTDIEFYKYAQIRFMRARYWLEHWDVAALLRRI